MSKLKVVGKLFCWLSVNLYKLKSDNVFAALFQDFMAFFWKRCSYILIRYIRKFEANFLVFFFSIM